MASRMPMLEKVVRMDRVVAVAAGARAVGGRAQPRPPPFARSALAAGAPTTCGREATANGVLANCQHGLHHGSASLVGTGLVVGSRSSPAAMLRRWLALQFPRSSGMTSVQDDGGTGKEQQEQAPRVQAQAQEPVPMAVQAQEQAPREPRPQEAKKEKEKDQQAKELSPPIRQKVVRRQAMPIDPLRRNRRRLAPRPTSWSKPSPNIWVMVVV